MTAEGQAPRASSGIDDIIVAHTPAGRHVSVSSAARADPSGGRLKGGWKPLARCLQDTLHETTDLGGQDTSHTGRFRLTLNSSWRRGRGMFPSAARPVPATHAQTTTTSSSSYFSDPVSTESQTMLLPMPRRHGMLDMSSQHAGTAGPPGMFPAGFTDELRMTQRSAASAPAATQFPRQHWTSTAEVGPAEARRRSGARAGDTTTWQYVPEYSTVTSGEVGTRDGSVWAVLPATPPGGESDTTSSAPLPERGAAPGGTASPSPLAPQDRTITTFRRHDDGEAPYGTASTADGAWQRIALHLDVSEAGETSGQHSVPLVQVTMTETTTKFSGADGYPSDRLPTSSVTSAHSAPAAVTGAYPGSQEGSESLPGVQLRGRADSLQTIAAVFPQVDPALRAGHAAAQPGSEGASKGPSGPHEQTPGSALEIGAEAGEARRADGAQHTAETSVDVSARPAAAAGADLELPLRPADATPAAATGPLPWLRRRLARRGGPQHGGAAAAAAYDAEGAPAADAEGGSSVVRAAFPSWRELQLQHRTEDRMIQRELQRIERLLNSLGEGAVVFDRFILLGRKDRRRGGVPPTPPHPQRTPSSTASPSLRCIQ